MGWMLAAVFLFICSYYDFRESKIPVVVLLAGQAVALLYCLGQRGEGGIVRMWIPGLLPGVFLLLMAFVCKNQLGYGDGLVLCTLGLYLEYQWVLWTCYLGLLFIFLFGMVQIVRKKGDMKSRYPFVPFLAVGFTVCIIRVLAGGVR